MMRRFIPVLLVLMERVMVYVRMLWAFFQPDVTKPAETIEYPFPIRSGELSRLTLPKDLTVKDVRRLEVFLTTLIMDNQVSQVPDSERRPSE